LLLYKFPEYLQASRLQPSADGFAGARAFGHRMFT
jgi:hypothetical protein